MLEIPQTLIKCIRKSKSIPFHKCFINTTLTAKINKFTYKNNKIIKLALEGKEMDKKARKKMNTFVGYQ